MKIALVIGHNSQAKGAYSPVLRASEYDWCGDLAEMIAKHAPKRYTIIRRTAGSGEIARAYAEVDKSGAVASIELHFNAASPAATGTETLSSGSTRSMMFCGHLQKAQLAALKLRDRGVKVLKAGDRGYASVRTGKAPAALIEPFFGSSEGDSAIAQRGKAALAEAIHHACTAYLKETNQ